MAVIPHYDNAEGGTHDTRFCYLGERRLALMEASLPADAAVLGVDEHTALVLDLVAGTAEVTGRGCVTVRRAGTSVAFEAPALLSLDQLRETARTGGGGVARIMTATWRDGQSRPETGLAPLPDLVHQAEQEFDRALALRDGMTVVQIILDLESAVTAWATDTEEDQGTEQARAVLRSLIARLGTVVTAGLSDPAERLAPGVGPLLALREDLRAEGRYPDADTIRAALTAGGIRISDSAGGTSWSLSGGPQA